ncbi:MAG TPA: hypothetical protein VFK04_13040 [Gemmatimonadaceae bacterium]|nr:hypothetical protein [Gemmatimonadaceae bacterium]
MRRTALLTAALGIALAACTVTPADAAPPPSELALAPVAACDAGKVCYRAAWPAVSDAAGAADHYRVRVTAPGVSIDTVVTATSFSFSVPCSPGASGTVTADVWSIRRDSVSKASAHASASYSCPDAPPPAPDSVIIAPVDSTAIASVLIEPAEVALVEGDSALVTAWRVDLAGRRTVPRSVRWESTDSAVALVRPVPGTATAWVIAPRGAASVGAVRMIQFPAVGT